MCNNTQPFLADDQCGGIVAVIIITTLEVYYEVTLLVPLCHGNVFIVTK